MLKTIVIFIIALLGFGMIRLPLQNRILEQEKAAGLLHGGLRLLPDFRLGQSGTPLQPNHLSCPPFRLLLGQRFVAFGQ